MGNTSWPSRVRLINFWKEVYMRALLLPAVVFALAAPVAVQASPDTPAETVQFNVATFKVAGMS